MAKALQLSTPYLPLSPISDLDLYLRQIEAIPMLTLEEERACALRLRRDNDLEAAKTLILSHLRFVVKIARGFQGYGLPMADLIQEGNIGLMKAVKRFDPNQEVRLSSFAIHWIKAEIHEFVIRNWRIVKVATTKAQRKLFFNLRRLKKGLNWLNPAEIQAVADKLDVSPQEVKEMEGRLYSQDLAYDVHNDDTEDEDFAPALYLQDNRYDPARVTEIENNHAQQHQDLSTALGKLDERSRDIIRQRWLKEEKSTLHELAAQYQVSAERVRQLEESAMKKLKGLMV